MRATALHIQLRTNPSNTVKEEKLGGNSCCRKFLFSVRNWCHEHIKNPRI